jgi:hypothetical protein
MAAEAAAVGCAHPTATRASSCANQRAVATRRAAYVVKTKTAAVPRARACPAMDRSRAKKPRGKASGSAAIPPAATRRATFVTIKTTPAMCPRRVTLAATARATPESVSSIDWACLAAMASATAAELRARLAHRPMTAARIDRALQTARACCAATARAAWQPAGRARSPVTAAAAPAASRPPVRCAVRAAYQPP